jgi:hypothetical protein
MLAYMISSEAVPLLSILYKNFAQFLVPGAEQERALMNKIKRTIHNTAEWKQPPIRGMTGKEQYNMLQQLRKAHFADPENERKHPQVALHQLGSSNANMAGSGCNPTGLFV